MKVKTKFLKVISDIHTPVGVYLKLRDLYSKIFLLESSDYKGSENRRGSKDDDGIHTRARDVENLNKWKRGKGNYSWPKEDTYQQ